MKFYTIKEIAEETKLSERTRDCGRSSHCNALGEPVSGLKDILKKMGQSK
jgi:hypothetical protein